MLTPTQHYINYKNEVVAVLWKKLDLLFDKITVVRQRKHYKQKEKKRKRYLYKSNQLFMIIYK